MSSVFFNFLFSVRHFIYNSCLCICPTSNLWTPSLLPKTTCLSGIATRWIILFCFKAPQLNIIRQSRVSSVHTLFPEPFFTNLSERLDNILTKQRKSKFPRSTDYYLSIEKTQKFIKIWKAVGYWVPQVNGNTQVQLDNCMWFYTTLYSL